MQAKSVAPSTPPGAGVGAGTGSAERILAAGITCFAARGFGATTTREVASAAGVNIATIAYHFGSKEGLYRAAIDRLYERLLAMRPALSMDGPVEERVDRLVRMLFAVMRAHPAEIRLLIRHVLDHGALPTPVRESWSLRLLERAEDARAALGLDLGDPAFPKKLLSVSYVLARYAISDASDLAPFFADEDQARAVEDHVAWVVRRILLDAPASGAHTSKTASTGSWSDAPREGSTSQRTRRSARGGEAKT